MTQFIKFYTFWVWSDLKQRSVSHKTFTVTFGFYFVYVCVCVFK